MARDVEFNLTASDKTGPALSKAEQAFVRSQTRIRKTADDNADKLFGNNLVRAVGKIAPKITGALVGAAGQAAAQSGPILAGVGAAAAPIIAGTLSAAIIGGAGIGGVLGGVALAARDPRVQAAGKTLGDNLIGQLTDFARPFIDPVLAGIGTIQSRFDEVGSNLRNIFAAASRYVAPLTDGVTRFLQGVIRGADALVSRAGPVIDALGRGLTELGGDVESFLTTISKGGDNAAKSVGQLVDLIGGTLAVLGPVINGINSVSAAFDKIGLSPGFLQFLGKINDGAESTGTFARRTQGATVAIAGQGAAAGAAAADLTALEAAIRGNINANVALYGSTTAAKQAIVEATAAVRANGATLSLNSEKGRENRATLQQLATSLNSQYDAYVRVNGAGAAADGVLRSNRDSFIRVATAASGSAAKARQLADDLLGIPDKRTPRVELLDNASGKINNVINRLAAVRSKTVTLNIAVRQSGDAAAIRKNSLPSGLAAGDGYARADPSDGGTYRTGGPRKVTVESNVTVTLDGRPFREFTTSAIGQDRARSDWRRKVGTSR